MTDRGVVRVEQRERPAFHTRELRVEGRLKVTGRADYAVDQVLPGMLWAAFRRSDVPHARIKSINADAARSSPGVHAVLTAADIGHARFGRKLLDQPVLADERVRFVGERIVGVAAETREAAAAAAERVAIEYEDLPPVLDPDAALREDAPVLHEHADRYKYLGGERPAVPHPNIQGRVLHQKGVADIEAVFATAPRVFEQTYTTPRQHHAYLEPHATIAWIDGDGVAHIVSNNKAPFLLRAQMAAALDLEPETLDVDSGFIGGDFGGKGYSPDEYACYFLARATRRPVKAVMSYVDEFSATNPRHASTIHLRTAVDEAGGFIAHDARVVFDGGAYAAAKPLPDLILAGGTQTLGAYRIPNVRVEELTVYTNTAPGGHMRSPGEVQALFAGESHVDSIARELGRDPLEFRLANALGHEDGGFIDERYREVRVTEVLGALRDASGWGSPLPPNRGRGVSVGRRHVGGGACVVRLALGKDGRVYSSTGVADQGGGAHTVLRRVVAGVLSLAETDVRIAKGSTGSAPYDPGAGASRLTHVLSRAAQLAANAFREAIEQAASRVVGGGSGLSLRDGRLVDRGGTSRATLRDVAARLIEEAGPIEVEHRYESGTHGPGQPQDFDFAGYVIEVEVDPETGQLSIRQAWLAADVGTVINPIAHQGQLEGGFVFGLGGAILEVLPVEDGRVQSLSFADYRIPTVADVPPLTTILLPTDVGPGAFGAKMVGELSNAAVAPAIANAVADAVDIRLLSLPITAESIHQSLRSSATTGAARN